MHGERENGTYRIRPSLKYKSFKVKCEFTETGGRSILMPLNWRENGFIYPENEHQRCTEPECFQHLFSYGPRFEQIEVSFFQRIAVELITL